MLEEDGGDNGEEGGGGERGRGRGRGRGREEKEKEKEKGVIQHGTNLEQLNVASV